MEQCGPYMKQLDLRALSHFIAVAEHGGLNIASRETGVPKATMSRQIRILEAQLGTNLLERGSGKAQMTEDGRHLFDRAAPLLAELEATGTEITERNGQVRGPLRISMPALIARSGIGAVITDFVKKYPLVELEVHIDDRFNDPVDDGYDLVVRANPAEDSDLVGKCFMRTEYVLASLPEMPVHSEQNSMIDAVVLLAQRDQSMWSVMREGKLISYMPRETIRCSSMMLVYEAVLAGAGAALLPARMISEDLRTGRLLSWGIVPNRDIEAWVLHAPTHVNSPKIKAFVEALVEAYRSPKT